MVYVALLRGINVGGKNKVDMRLLKQTFERVGMESVVTYINSGNVIFTANSHPKADLSSTLEKAIKTDFGLNIKVLIRSREEMKQIIGSLPPSWTNDQKMKSDVLFLWEEVAEERVLDHLVVNPEIDTVKYVPGAVLWSVDKMNLTKSGMSRLSGAKLYKQMTIRNVNTTRKIYELMEVDNESLE